MTFTLSDAIEHEKEMAESGYGSSSRANEHRQIVIWLEELKERREQDEHRKSMCDISQSNE